MDGESKKSTRKQMLHTLSKPFKYLSKSQGQSQESLVDPPDRPVSVLPNVPREPDRQERAEVLGLSPRAGSTQTIAVPEGISGEPPTGEAAPAGTGSTAFLLTAVPTASYGSRTQSSTAAQITKNVVKGALGLLSSAAEGIPIPGIKGIFDTISKVVGAIEATQANQEGFKALEIRCNALLDTVVIPLKGKSDIPLALQASLAKLESGLNKLFIDVENQLALGTMARFINNEDNLAVLTKMDQEIAQFLELYSATLLTHVHQTILGDREKQAIEKLPKVKAGYDDRISGIQDRASCFAGTREQLLTEIKGWIHDTNMDKPIYVLYGIAGIGKTTVAQTVAEYAAGLKLLGASFFFSRAEDDRKSGDYFFSTLAFQLALYDAHLGAYIAAALMDAPDTPHKILATQLKHLIVDPIQKIKPQIPLILVIDAFDECLATDGKTILDLLAKNIQYMPNCKVFITTRPESHIQTVLAARGHLQPFFLHEIETSVAKGDVRLFLKHELSKEQIARYLQFNNWEPTEADLKSLVEKCGILFIMASTAVRYILDEALNKPALQLGRLLAGLDIKEGEYGVMSSLDKMYLEILRSSVPRRDSAEYILDFKRVVGAIVVLEDLLPLSSLANLLSMQGSDVQTTLQNLHSIMAPVSSNQAPQLYHKSFPDFLTDRNRCIDNKFHVVPQEHHAQIAQFCFITMAKALHENMLGLQGPHKYMANIEIMDSSNVKIANEIKYACMYWATHLRKAGDDSSEELLKLLSEFAFTHLLHWIEALSLIGKLDFACPALKHAQEVLANWNLTKVQGLNEILNDGSRCVTKFYDIIKISALHIYYSALPFMPTKSQIYQVYHHINTGIIAIKGQQTQWDLLLATLKGHSGDVNSVAFSPDGSMLASSSRDSTVRLWGVGIGAHVATLEGHSGYVNTVVFSFDGSRLATGSSDNTVRLWDGDTGTHVATLKHSSEINTIAFSPDDSRLATGSDYGTIKLWNALTGAFVATWQAYLSDVNINSIAFSFDGSRLASGAHDEAVKLWNGATGHFIATLDGHLGTIYSVAFSPNSFILASGSRDSTVKLWDGVTGAYITNLEGHSERVNAITFSPDGLWIASGSHDTTVMLWDAVTGAHTATLEGHSKCVNIVAFSPTSSRLASGSSDNTIKLWDVVTGTHIATLEGHSDKVHTVAFSPDGSRIASGSDDSTVKLWDGITGAYIPPQQTHSDWVRTMAFSPDGLRLATGSDDSSIKLWDSATGDLIATLEGHSYWVVNVAFSSDGSTLTSKGSDGVLKHWDGFTGNPIISPHSSQVILSHAPSNRGHADSSHNPTELLDSTPQNSVTYILLDNAIRHPTSSAPVLWLPSEFHNPSSYATQGNMFAIGSGIGQVVILNLS